LTSSIWPPNQIIELAIRIFKHISAIAKLGYQEEEKGWENIFMLCIYCTVETKIEPLCNVVFVANFECNIF
jgi:hypothetical protein